MNDDIETEVIYCWIDGTWVYQDDYDGEMETVFGTHDFTIEVDVGTPTSEIHKEINRILGMKR